MKLPIQYKKTVRRISLTPLADLVFILLVFFILETTFVQYRELEVDTPQSYSSGARTEKELDIEIFEDEILWIQGEALALHQLGNYLDTEKFQRESVVNIKVQDEASLQLLVTVMDQLKFHGMNRILVLPLSSISSPG